MLTEKHRLQQASVNAVIVPYGYRDLATPETIHRSRFRGVLDENGHECGAVTKQYRLVNNRDLVGAIDLASDKLGVVLECGKSKYYKGKFNATFWMPDEFTVPGDASGVRPQVSLGNSYGGTAALTGQAGVFRLICSNGAMIGKVVRQDYQKHVGDFDLLQFVEGLLLAVICRAEEYKKVALQAAETHLEEEVRAAVDALIISTTPKKYHPTLVNALNSNRYEMGDTVWAIVQAISEVSTHDMKGLNAADWQMRQTNMVLNRAGILV